MRWPASELQSNPLLNRAPKPFARFLLPEIKIFSLENYVRARYATALVENSNSASGIASQVGRAKGCSIMWAKKSARKVSTISDIEFDFVLKADVPRIVENWRRLNYRRYIVLTNPHSVMVCHRDEEMRSA